MADLKSQRQKELEEKRKKLEALRAQAKQLVEPPPAAAPAAKAPVATPTAPDLKKVDNVEDLLRGLDAIPAPLVSSTLPIPKLLPESTATEPKKAEGDSASAASAPAPRPAPVLATAKIVEYDIAPKQVPKYSKGTQTIEVPRDATAAAEAAGKPAQAAPLQEVKAEAAAASQLPEAEAPKETVRELTDAEKKQLLSSADFKSSIEKATKIMERAVSVANRFDVFADYSEADASGKDSLTGEGRKVVEAGRLYDERWCRHRSVTDIAVSPKHPDLLAVSYSQSETGSADSDGLVLVWSMQNLLQRPEYVFTCQSPVLAVTFSRFAPTIVVGGTYSGQVVLWDMRAKSTPVSRTPLSSVGHTHPIYSLAIVGTQNANNLVSISTDGRLCVWSLDSLHQPQEVLELHNKQTKSVSSVAPIAVTSLAFPDGETNEFFVGSEEGAVFQAFRHGSKTGVFERFDGHYGPVTALSFHPTRDASPQLSDLFLTSSVDWTVKLWSRKVPGRALYSFEEASDYVYDARWSPVNPCLWACADGKGSLYLWNLGIDTEQPVLRHTASSASTRALNRLCWTPDGRRLVAGDVGGALTLWDVGDLAFGRPAEAAAFEDKLRDFVAAAAAAPASDPTAEGASDK